ncbi:MAG: hypothetical protein Q8908_11675, partial [Bacteroidota bacterium]|nr:hypothetical protein [Bacteroidota bacterium]
RNGFIFSAKHTHHPSDISSNLKLVSLARITSEEIIDALCKEMNHTPRPRTYRQRAFDEYKRATDDIPHNSKENQKVIIRQISFLNRNIRSIHRLLDLVSPPVFKDNRLIITEIKPWPLDNMVLRRFWIIQQVLEQQIRMVKNGRTHISDRIIDIEHPYTRPPINTEARFRSLKKRIHLLEQAF